MKTRVTKTKLTKLDAMFVTNHYRILKLMADNSVAIGNNKYCPLGQGELAQQAELSRVIVNRIFGELKAKGYIEMLSRGNWQVTIKGEKFIAKQEG